MKQLTKYIVDTKGLKNTEGKDLLKLFWADKYYEDKGIKRWRYWVINEDKKEKSKGCNMYEFLTWLEDEYKDWPVITYQEWQDMKGFKTTEKKIIGYKAPKDLFGGDIKKDTLYVICVNPNYFKVKGTDKDDSWDMPAEIVEEWEPVYEEEIKEIEIVLPIGKVKVMRDGEIDFRDLNGGIWTAKIGEIKNLKAQSSLSLGLVGEVEVTINSVHIGCGKGPDVTIKQLNTVIEAYDKAFKK